MSDYAEIVMYQHAQRLPEARRAEFMMAYHVRHKDRSIVLLLSIFLGMWGVDRFYLGQIGLGIAKLVGAWITCGIWWVVDLFLIMRAADQYNVALAEKLAAMQAPALPVRASDAYTGLR